MPKGFYKPGDADERRDSEEPNREAPAPKERRADDEPSASTFRENPTERPDRREDGRDRFDASDENRIGRGYGKRHTEDDNHRGRERRGDAGMRRDFRDDARGRDTWRDDRRPMDGPPSRQRYDDRDEPRRPYREDRPRYDRDRNERPRDDDHRRDRYDDRRDDRSWREDRGDNRRRFSRDDRDRHQSPQDYDRRDRYDERPRPRDDRPRYDRPRYDRDRRDDHWERRDDHRNRDSYRGRERDDVRPREYDRRPPYARDNRYRPDDRRDDRRFDDRRPSRDSRSYSRDRRDDYRRDHGRRDDNLSRSQEWRQGPRRDVQERRPQPEPAAEKRRRFKPPTPPNLDASKLDEPIRLNKFIARSTQYSRRESDDLVKRGRVTVNGEVVSPGMLVQPGDVVLLDEKPIHRRDHLVYLLINKPRGAEAVLPKLDPETPESGAPTNLSQLLKFEGVEQLAAIAPLASNMLGLQLVSNDPAIERHFDKHPPKASYTLTLAKPGAAEWPALLLSKAEEAKVDLLVAEYVDEARERLSLVVRGAFPTALLAELEIQAERIDRLHFAGLTKKDLPRGHWRFLNEREVTWVTMFQQ